MPTIIALDVSLSMTRVAYCNREQQDVTYTQLAIQGINEFLDYLQKHKSLEFVSLIVYSSLYEQICDFTKDYSQIREALKRIEHYDRTSLFNLLAACSNIFSSNWGNQNFATLLIVTDCGIGLGKSSLKNVISGIALRENNPLLPMPFPCKLSIMCLGNADDDIGFKYGINLYQQMLDVSKQKGQLFMPRISDKFSTERSVMKMFKAMCETNYKPFEAVLSCGSYFKLQSPISLFPAPQPYVSKDMFGNETSRMISRRLEVCGYIKIADIISGSGGSPASISRNLIFPRLEFSQKKNGSELEKMESEMKNFFAKNAQPEDEESSSSQNPTDITTRESVCVLLHGALKIESMAALILLDHDWFGFAYPYVDKKKSNLLLSILPPGANAVPWLGDLRNLGMMEDGESYGFPVKTDKKSYTQNVIVWINPNALQSDVQKIMRHAKKMPEKTTHFYKELNRVRRNAQSLGFKELLEVLADIFEKEAQILMQPGSNAHAECSIQLTHAASELRRGVPDLIKKYEPSM